LLRSKITNNEFYTLRGFIEKSIKNSSIELRFGKTAKKEE